MTGPQAEADLRRIKDIVERATKYDTLTETQQASLRREAKEELRNLEHVIEFVRRIRKD
jgi:hypothetical protein